MLDDRVWRCHVNCRVLCGHRRVGGSGELGGKDGSTVANVVIGKAR
jgi:hypothetical protein